MERYEEAKWLYPLVVDYARRKVCECRNTTFILDYKNRLVYCKNCGAIVDPFDALLHMARNAERIHDYLEGYREAAEKERKTYDRYRGVNNLTRRDKEGLVPVCPNCNEPFAPEQITSFVARRFLEKEAL